jgi:hypothetical protein
VREARAFWKNIGMRIIGVTMASNEADVIEAFVRHNLQFLDAMVVLDHVSVDRTLEILTRLAGEGLPLVVLKDRDRAYRQGERMTLLARRYLAELDADWCFAIDADEFIRCESRPRLEAALGAVPAGVHALVALQNYVAGSDGSDPQVLRRITRRLRQERAVSRKVVVRRGFEALPTGQISIGNHAALQVLEGEVKPLPHLPLEGVALAHVPVRSPRQVAQKALIGWLAMRLTRPERYARPGQAIPASHWRALFERLARGDPVDESFTREAIAAYVGGPVDDAELVHDPVPTVDVRYVESAEPSPLASLANWADQVVGEMLQGSGQPR